MIIDPAELWDLRKDYSHQPGERILTWLVRCWDNGARSHMLEGHEAQQLGSLARDREIEQGIAREPYSHSLWLRILTAVRERFPFKEYLTSSPRKWTTAEEGIQYLRELAMLELIFSKPDYYDILDPARLPCTNPMWRKVIKGAPAQYINCLISAFHPKLDEPDVETMCQWIQTIAENFEDLSDVRYQPTRSKGRMEGDYEYSKYEDDYEDRDDSVSQDYRDTPVKRSRPRARPQPRSWSRSQSTTPPPTRSRKAPNRQSRTQLWSYLRNHGENMKKWDGQPTSKLQARVKELKQKEVNKKLVFVVDADFVEKQLRSPQYKKAEVHFPDDKKAAGGAKRTSDTDCSDKDH